MPENELTPVELDRLRKYDEGIARFHAQHDEPDLTHLTTQAIVNCSQCDDEGYRGGHVCDHIDHHAQTVKGRAAVQAELAKIRARRTAS